MKGFKTVPLIFLVVGGSVGVLMRFHLYSPFRWLNFSNLLHAHSHLLVLGWILNCLLLIYHNLFTKKEIRYRVLFLCIQVVIALLFVSFLVQGYGFYSILFSALHLALTGIYLGWIYRTIRYKKDLAHRTLRLSLLLFGLSSLGPLLMGPLTALHLISSQERSCLIHFYLHFLIDGAFLLGALAVFFKLAEERTEIINERRIHQAISLLFSSVFPCFLLSIASEKMPGVFFLIAATGFVMQMTALLIVFHSVGFRILNGFKKVARRLFMFAAACLLLKVSLQLFIVATAATNLVYVRPFIVAYLHLMLVGVMTSFLFGWYDESAAGREQSWNEMPLFMAGFAGIEGGLFLQGASLRIPRVDSQLIVLVFSLLLWLSFAVQLKKQYRKASSRRQKEENLMLTAT